MKELVAAIRPVPGALVKELRALRWWGPGAAESLKPVLSVLLATGVATVLQLDDLVWAAFSGYMVMRGDVHESIHRGLNRIAGTASGAVAGLILAPLVADNPIALIASLFFVSWLGIYRSYTSAYSYAWIFFGLTAGLVMTEALSSPTTVVHFASTRVAEIVVGTASCVLVGSLFSSANARLVSKQVEAMGQLSVKPLSDSWLRERWSLIVHSTRAALAVALLPLMWRWFSITDFSQTAVTSYVVMIVPVAAVKEYRYQTVYERMVHRAIGCLLGSVVALLSVAILGGEFMALLITTSLGVWLGYNIQTGKEGVAYVGTQFVLGLLMTLIQGPGTIVSPTPGLDRLLGIILGSATLYILMLLWPFREEI